MTKLTNALFALTFFVSASSAVLAAEQAPTSCPSVSDLQRITTLTPVDSEPGELVSTASFKTVKKARWYKNDYNYWTLTVKSAAIEDCTTCALADPSFLANAEGPSTEFAQTVDGSTGLACGYTVPGAPTNIVVTLKS